MILLVDSKSAILSTCKTSLHKKLLGSFVSHCLVGIDGSRSYIDLREFGVHTRSCFTLEERDEFTEDFSEHEIPEESADEREWLNVITTKNKF